MEKLIDLAVEQLLKAVLEMKDKAAKFKPTLERLETTLNSLGPKIRQIEELNKILDRPAEETERLIEDMKRGRKLVQKCSDSKLQWWQCYYMANYQEKLEELDESIRRFFQLEMQAQNAVNVLATLVKVKEFHAEFRRNQRIELRGVCLPPEPPSVTVGFEVPLNELRLKLLRDQVSVSVLTVTGSGGSGKTTLAKMFCSDVPVKGKFKDNIFFVTYGRTPKLSTIVQKLFQHTGFHVPGFQGDEDAVNQLEHLLKQIGKGPILLVLDDIWPGSESLVDNFVFEMMDFNKIL